MHRMLFCGALFLFLLFLFVPCLDAFSIAPPTVLDAYHRSLRTKPRASPILFARARSSSSTNQQTAQSLNGWFPCVRIEDDDIYGHKDEDNLFHVEDRAVLLAADLVRARLQKSNKPPPLTAFCNDNVNEDATASTSDARDSTAAVEHLVRGRFMDLTCTAAGESVLEGLFLDEPDLVAAAVEKDGNLDVIRGAVMIFQSLCAMGTQVGVTGVPEKLRRMVAHLDDRNDLSLIERDLLHTWDRDSVRRLKYRLDRSPALALLAELKRKRNTIGAYDLLLQLGAWQKHEDLALLRSGFPLRFTEEEENIARKAFNNTVDPDGILGLRKDLRGLKVFTIDSASASEIDDGLSVETIRSAEGSERHRIWIHIADADRWAPRNSPLSEVARQRITSLYLPQKSISMFPSSVSRDLMSLKANSNSYALSLGVELNQDGSIDTDSVVVTPSIIRVAYRLTYEDVDEMLYDGIAYNEEWELGALLTAAVKRRNYRMANGSVEAMVSNPIPYASVSAFPDATAPEGIGISLRVEVSHNAGKNLTSGAEDVNSASSVDMPVSSAYLLVTEAMILAGESISQWKTVMDEEKVANGASETESMFHNALRLGFRTQPKPAFKSRSRERRVLMDLTEYNVGGGYCQAWYIRRFLESVKITETMAPHSGLGISGYVQWTSPIRRFGDLQVHTAVKRFLRRKKVFDLIRSGWTVPDGVSASDLGLEESLWHKNSIPSSKSFQPSMLDNDINFLEGVGLASAARMLQRQSQRYWLYEHIRRIRNANPDKTYEALILGCVDPERGQFAIYIYDLGLEHRYTSPGRLDPGVKLQLRVDKVAPRSGILSFVRAF